MERQGEENLGEKVCRTEEYNKGKQHQAQIKLGKGGVKEEDDIYLTIMGTNLLRHQLMDKSDQNFTTFVNSDNSYGSV